MADEITHAVFAEKAFEALFGGKNKQEFFIGSLFPDIRYLGVIKRSETHFWNVTIDGILKEKSSFWSGVKFHSFVDRFRQDFIFNDPRVRDLGAGLGKKEHLRLHVALKLLEDELFYPRIDNWQEKVDFLAEILPEETSFGISPAMVKKWHLILQENFSAPPSDRSRRSFFRSLGFKKKRRDLLNKTVLRLRQKKELIRMIERLYRRFEEFILASGKPRL
ncbi:MAG: hypothetical protein ABH867_00265 [Patescibacteria group bacterium]|nr:hypothetical protein [Patescibacteria group bacterium]